MPDRTISVVDSKGHRVLIDQVPGEEPLPALVTSVEVVGRMVTVAFKDHPTVGSHRVQYPRGHRLVLNDSTKRARRT